MLKIESIRMSDGRPKLRVEGRVIGPWVAELRLACEQALGEGVGLALDLSEVAFVDQTGLEFLRALGQRGVAFDRSEERRVGKGCGGERGAHGVRRQQLEL